MKPAGMWPELYLDIASQDWQFPRVRQKCILFMTYPGKSSLLYSIGYRVSHKPTEVVKWEGTPHLAGGIRF